MKIFIFEYVGQLTSSYHSGGGLVVIAQNQESAAMLIGTDTDIQLTPQDWEEVKVLDLVTPTEPKMYIFPDAGCC